MASTKVIVAAEQDVLAVAEAALVKAERGWRMWHSPKRKETLDKAQAAVDALKAAPVPAPVAAAPVSLAKAASPSVPSDGLTAHQRKALLATPAPPVLTAHQRKTLDAAK